MKKLFALLLSFVMVYTIANAQTTTSTEEREQEDYEQYFDAKLRMDYRNATIEALNLTKEETVAFDPVFKNYMRAKRNLTEKKLDLVEDFKAEIAEDDSFENEQEDRADFIEDYWELAIDEMKLRKDYFDILEDKIAVDKAARFFLWEESMDTRMQRTNMIEVFPIIIKLNDLEGQSYNSNSEEQMNKKGKQATAYSNIGEPMNERETPKQNKDVKKNKSYSNATWKTTDKKAQNAINDLDTWVSSNKGLVDISHDYTYNGVSKILTALEAINDSDMMNRPSFGTEKVGIMKTAKQLRKDPYATTHADMAREIFISIADMFPNNENLSSTARSIKKDELLTKQSDTIYAFFEQANDRIQSMAKGYEMNDEAAGEDRK
ncbi:MAG: hypothetical protein AAF849_14170 [Bacteroidota bacterium]